jgi:predicted transcriptional regulator
MSDKRAVEARRNKVMTLLAKCATEEEIAMQLGVDQSTVNRDIKALKLAAQKWVYDLAKSDLAYVYKQSIDGINEVAKEAWKIYNNSIDQKVQLQALREIRECGQSVFNLFNQGPSIMNIKALEERVNRIESRSGERERQIPK